MADDDRTEVLSGGSVTHSAVSGPPDDVIALEPVVSEWLAARVAVAKNEVVVSVTVVPGRWLFRVEWGQCSSMIEQPVRSERAVSELVTAVRRWARNAGLNAHIVASHGDEQRVVMTPTSVRSS